MEFYGKIDKYDSDKEELIFKLSFIDPESMEKINKLLTERKRHKITIRGVRVKDELADLTRRRWFYTLKRILESQGIIPDPDTLSAFHNDIKESEFEAKEFTVDGKVIPVVPSLTSLPDDEVNTVINKLQERYSRIGVDFTK